MNRDWTGSSKSAFFTNGATGHGHSERVSNDFYATDPFAAELLLGVESFSDNVWEPACGLHHLSSVFKQSGYKVRESDIVDRDGTIEEYDFLSMDNVCWDGDIVTNPPYKYAREFVEKALQIIPNGRKVAMFLKLTFLEGKSRKQFFKNTPPHFVYVSSSRILCAPNGDFSKMEGSAVAYAWYVWEKGYKGDTIIKWIN